MIAAALAFALLRQDTIPNLPARARAMLAAFPVPREGEVLVTTRFSKDSAWIGEQVDLLTAAWFPEELRSRLRRSPTLTAPSLSGLWSVQSRVLPVLAGTRRVGRQMYAVYVQYQTLFPLGAGKVDAPPAVLSYSVPTSSSFFAPEDRKTVSSEPARLIVRPVPTALLAEVGSGPTASGLHVIWVGPAAPMRVGVPTTIEFRVAGTGNLALWPSPDIDWPAGLRIYPERTEETYQSRVSLISGEKHFRFTIVADTAGIFRLPDVHYPYFDPDAAQAQAAMASPFALPVLPAAASTMHPEPPIVTGAPGIPLVSTIVRQGWPALLLLFLLPPLLLLWRSWRARPRPVPGVAAATDPERELRSLLNQPSDSGPARVAAALRHRGVPRGEAEQLHRWLVAVARRRYGPAGGEAPSPPDVMGPVLQRLRRSVAPLVLLLAMAGTAHGQIGEAAKRYQAGDYPGATLRYEAFVAVEPDAANAWGDLGSARWMNGDDAGAAAAWLHALALAPRDPFVRAAWQANSAIPEEVRDLAPRIPLSRDELWLLALGCWLLGWAVRASRFRQWSMAFAGMTILFGATAAMRWYQETRPRALLRNSVSYRVSPIPTAPELGNVPGWTLIDIVGRRGGWVLAELPGGRRGWIPEARIAPLAPLD